MLNFVYAFQVIVVFFTVIISSILTNLGLFFVYFERFFNIKYCSISLESHIVYRLKTFKILVSFVLVRAPIILKTFHVLF